MLYPTETFRFQSSSIKNIAMNGDVRYTKANSNLPNYYENFQGLDGATRAATFTGSATATREEVGADYGITWQATKKVSLSDQVNFSNVHQPGTSTINEVNYNTPTTVVAGNNGYETINYSGTLTTVANGITAGGSSTGTPLPGYFGQKFVTNNATVSWDASDRASFSLTYRYRTHDIVQGAATGTASSLITINENGGIFNAALRPTDRWNLNGTVEIFYDDNAFTPVSPRQTKIYRVHSLYRPRTWASVTTSYLDTERHNNTNNTGVTPIDGPLAACGPQPGGQHLDGPVAERALWLRLQLCLLGCLYLDQHLLPERRHGDAARYGLGHQHRSCEYLPRGLRQGIDHHPLRLGSQQGLHGCSHPVRHGLGHALPQQENRVEPGLHDQRSQWQPVLQ